MDTSHLSFKIPQTLHEKIKTQQLVPLIGAGLSMSMRDKNDKRVFPSWEELLQKSADALGKEDKEDDQQLVNLFIKKKKLHKAAEAAREGLIGSTWYNFLKKQFVIDYEILDLNSAALPKAMWQLSSQLITLNYEKILQWASEQPSNVTVFDNSNKTALADFSRVTGGQKVWHLHGHIDDPQHIILTPDSYSALYPETDGVENQYKAALQTLRTTLQTKSLLFVGCSLNDIELLNELNKQNELFSGNTGPHYALVHKSEAESIKRELLRNRIQIEILEFSDFGGPLVKVVNELAECRVQEVKISENKKYTNADLNITPKKTRSDTPQSIAKIALMVANPLDKPQDQKQLYKSLKKFKYPLQQLPLTIETLQGCDDCPYVLIATRLTPNGLLIEDDEVCSQYISIKEIIGNLPVTVKSVIIISDRLPEANQIEELEESEVPLLILPFLHSPLLDDLFFKVLKKYNFEYIKKGFLKGVLDFNLLDLKSNNNHSIIQIPTKLPSAIDRSSLVNFTGRESDLASLSRQLLKLDDLTQVLTVKGSGGLGKTTIIKKLVVELASRGRYSAGITFVDCEPLKNYRALELQLATAFGLQQADQLLQYLHDHHDKKSRLIILDNFESLLHLPGSETVPGTHLGKEIECCKALVGRISEYASILITSRELLQTDWEDHYTLRSLTSNEALDLFNLQTKNRFNNDLEQVYLRREILEPLLDNNPLAIKLISGSLPKGKDLKKLKEELEQNFFEKVRGQYLEVFDDIRDDNIDRQDSLYSSVLYSYNTLNESEKQAFERLSLFPDGINLTEFQDLTNRNSGKKYNEVKRPITDREIKALSDKSLLESQRGLIKLQSIINRFATHKFKSRENNDSYYQTAFEYNAELMESIRDMSRINRYRSQQIFNENINNLLNAIGYWASICFSSLNMNDYLLFLQRMSVSVCLTNFTSSMSLKLQKTLEHSNFENISELQKMAIDVLIVATRYYSGEFTTAYADLKGIISIEKLKEINPSNVVERIITYGSYDIYYMEGSCLDFLENNMKHNLFNNLVYPAEIAQLGFVYPELGEFVEPGINYFESMLVQGGVDIEGIDEVIKDLHPTSHLERNQLCYLRSRLSPIPQHEIEKLVSVNPYTRGLKYLMSAFSSEQRLTGILEVSAIQELTEKIINYYEDALPALSHIKFYYMQGHFYYAKFLKQQQLDYENVYQQGISLATKHHYRFWLHKFRLIENSTLGNYREENYPLPGSPDPTELVNSQIKYIKQNQRGQSR